MSEIQVAIFMGSQSDEGVMQQAAEVLDDFGIRHEMKVLSAKGISEKFSAYEEDFRKNGGRVFICTAGISSALAGIVSAHTTLPVLGVPINTDPLKGIDALLSTVQMPPEIPVGGVAVGETGAQNAALFAARILSLTDDSLAKKLDEYREANRQKILNTVLN